MMAILEVMMKVICYLSQGLSRFPHNKDINEYEIYSISQM
jgi:hypothetical protein